AGPRHAPTPLRRPPRLARRDGGALLGREARRREPDGCEVGAGVERVAELLEDDGFLDEAEAYAAFVLGDRDAEPTEVRKLRPRVVPGRVPVAVERVPLREPRARLPLQLQLLVCEGEVH